MEKTFHENANTKKAAVAILISYKVDFETKTVTRQRKTLYNDEGIDPGRRYNNCKYIYAPNIGIPKYMKSILTNMKKLTLS